jgi:hypothetical protein
VAGRVLPGLGALCSQGRQVACEGRTWLPEAGAIRIAGLTGNEAGHRDVDRLGCSLVERSSFLCGLLQDRSEHSVISHSEATTKGAMMTRTSVKAVVIVMGVVGVVSLVPLWGQQSSATRPASGAYGPAMRRTLNPDGTGKQTMLDLDKGRVVDMPTSVKPLNQGGSLAEFAKWATESGVDLVGDGGPFLVDAVMFPAPATLWEQPPKEMILRLLREAKAGSLSLITPESDGRPNFYVFRTREGAIGVLRMVNQGSHESEPPTWSVEYRLLEEIQAQR